MPGQGARSPRIKGALAANRLNKFVAPFPRMHFVKKDASKDSEDENVQDDRA